MSEWVDCKPGDWVRLRNGQVWHVTRIESHFGDTTGWGIREDAIRHTNYFEPSDVVEVIRHEPFYTLTDEDRAAWAAYTAALGRIRKAMPWVDAHAWLRGNV